MERCSYFIPDKALFGSFPTQDAVYELEASGVRYFVDLTDRNEEKTVPYKTNFEYIKYPIQDRKIPENWKTFAQLILELCDMIRNLKTGELIYVHCRGGHGRSGVLVACILCHYYQITPDEALRQTSTYHSRRPEMREKWRKIGSPQGKKQKNFVYQFFKPFWYDHPDYFGFSNFSSHAVTTFLGTFPNVHYAFQAFRAPEDKEFLRFLSEGKVTHLEHNNRQWEEKKGEYMYLVLKSKFSQYPDLRRNLVSTGLRPLVKVSFDPFWGNGGNGLGQNMHGRILSKIRSEFLKEDFRREMENQA